jgi:hypothetical protein
VKKEKKKGLIIFLIVFIFLLVGVIVTYLVVVRPMPVALISEYGISTLWEEGVTMNECAECHSSEDFHSCNTCHDEHGSSELTSIGFYNVIELTGDVPDPAYVEVNELLPNQDESGTFITIFDFLAKYGVESFESVTLITSDGGYVTVEYQYLDETAILVPYVDGIRFASETIHASAWMKGISRIIIVGLETPLAIEGQATSIGRVLIENDSVGVVVEGTDVMLANEEKETSHAMVANIVEGVLLTSLLENPSPAAITVTSADGETFELEGSEIEGSILGIVDGEVTLVLPERGRSAWLSDVVEIESNE